MFPVSTRTFSFLFIVLVALVGADGARATVSVDAEGMSLPGVVLDGLHADLTAAGDGMGVALTVQRADLAAMGWHKATLDLDGTLARDEPGRWTFAGNLRMRGASGDPWPRATVRMVADTAANTLELTVRQDASLARVAMPMDQTTHAQITLKDLPAGWLQGLLSTVWSGRMTTGRVDADLALDLLPGGVQAGGQFALAGVGFDSPGGTLAGETVSGSGRLGVDSQAEATVIELDAALRGGSLLLGPLYVDLPAHPVQLSFSTRAQKGAMAIRRLRLTDPDALQLEGEVGLAADGSLASLRLDRFDARFPAAYARYGKGLARSFGVDALDARGDVTGHLTMGAKGPQAFAFQTTGLDISNGEGRFGVQGLHGAVDWSATEDRPATKLGWRALQMQRIPNGAAEAALRSTGGTLGLLAPLVIPVLDGQLRVQRLAWKPAATAGDRLQTSLVLTQIDMAAFCRALGWPEFKGTLGGAVPSLRYVDDRVEMAGGLSLNIFDGFVDITGMSLAQPFGVAPILTGTLSLRQLDLGLMTSVFDFGSITGRLDGGIDNLRLVAWQPAAFDAHLLAGGGGRISQKAVNNLTSVGGGGIAAGLQGTVLKIFKTFGYKRIGLSCRLRGDVCAMGGLGAAKDGYTIVEGSGLPRLTVVGHQREVDWPTLVRRLQAATQGDGPVVR